MSRNEMLDVAIILFSNYSKYTHNIYCVLALKMGCYVMLCTGGNIRSWANWVCGPDIIAWFYRNREAMYKSTVYLISSVSELIQRKSMAVFCWIMVENARVKCHCLEEVRLWCGVFTFYIFHVSRGKMHERLSFA